MKNFFSKKLNVILLLLTVAVFAISCQNNASDASNSNDSSNATDNSASDKTPKETTTKLDESKDYGTSSYHDHFSHDEQPLKMRQVSSFSYHNPR